MISVEGLSYAYNSEKRIVFKDFSINAGEHWLLLGQSGSGKTTLLHLLGGLLKSQQGKILINKTDVAGLSESQMDTFRGRTYGYIFQKNHLISALSVKDNLLLSPFLANLRQDENRVAEVLNLLDLGGLASSKISELSLGQAQRVAIARAVLNKPAILIADEPTSALDDKNCERVADLLLSVSAQSNSTLLIATHDQRLKSRIKNQIQL